MGRALNSQTGVRLPYLLTGSDGADEAGVETHHERTQLYSREAAFLCAVPKEEREASRYSRRVNLHRGVVLESIAGGCSASIADYYLGPRKVLL